MQLKVIKSPEKTLWESCQEINFLVPFHFPAHFILNTQNSNQRGEHWLMSFL